MKIETDESAARLVDATEDEREWVRDFLTFETVAFIRGKRRVSSRSYLGYRGGFPVGLVPMVKRHATRDGIPVDITDVRLDPPGRTDLDTSWLRDYQHSALDKCLGASRGVVSSPTGSGKGEIITALVGSVDCEWLVLVHRDNLVLDLGQRYERRTGQQCGWIREGQFDPLQVTFGTFQSLYRALGRQDDGVLDYLEGVEGLVVDEAHTVAADTFNLCTSHCGSTYYRLGFSGTPFDRTDQRSIAVIAAIGPRIVRIKTSMLIERGFIPRPIIKMVACHQEDTGHRKYQTVYKHLVKQSKRRNKVCLDIIREMDKPGIAFVQHRDHGLHLAAHAAAEGYNVQYVDGKTPKPARLEALKAIQRGALDVIISTVVFQEGVDVPELRSVANFAGGASVIAVLQRLGRGMRKEDAEDHTFEVWDVYDGGQKWLADHSRKRAMAMVREEHTVSLMESADSATGTVFDDTARVDWA